MSEFGHTLPEGQFGPSERGSSRRSGWSWRRLGLLAATFVLVVGVTTTLTAGALLWLGERSVTRVDVPGLAGRGTAVAGAEELSEIMNVLIVGDDSRDGLSEEQLLRLGTEDVDGGRTDTVMLLQLDPQREQVSLLSFPRDLLVTRCDGSRGRINAAYGVGEASGVGGAACLVDTVAELTGIPLTHYVKVNFAGFVDVVDALGGVTLYIEQPGLQDRYAGLDLEAGCQRLDGVEALAFVRARRIDNDFGRIARQQRFVRELTSEITSAGTLLNVPRLFALVDAAGRAVETDRDLSLADMRRIAFSLRSLTAEQLDTRSVPAVPRTVGGAAMAVVKEEEAEALFTAFREGTLVPDHLGREDSPKLTNEDVPPLTVLNGVGTDGVAASAAEYLEERGFSVRTTDNANSFGYTEVLVMHPSGQREEAELVAAAFESAVVEEGDPDGGFTVVIGSEFDPDVEDAPAVAPPSPRATRSPAPSPEPTFAGATPAEHRC